MWFRICSLLLLLSITQLGCDKSPDSLEHAQRLMEVGEYVRAADVLERTLELDPENAEAHYQVGICYQELEDHDRALPALRQALRLAPSVRNQVALGLTYQGLGMHQRAMEQFLAAVQTEGSEPWIPAIAQATGDTHPVRQLTENEVDDYDPVFSPDGSEIGIASFRVQNAELYLLDLEGRLRRRVTYTDDKNEGSPTFTPDGEWMVFEAVSNENREGGLVLQASGSTATDSPLEAVHIYGREVQPAFPGQNKGTKPAISPDGGYVAFQSIRDGNMEVYIADRAAEQIRRMTDDPGDDGTPSFAPDGTEIAFVSSRHGNYELYTLPVEGGTPERLTHNDYGDYDPVFSPDGRSIAYVSEENQDIEIYQLDRATGEIQQLTNGIGASVQPNYSPDGQKLVFVSDRTNFLQIYLMDLSRYPTREELTQRILEALNL